ncbi:Respiratory supercomplex factor 2 -like protein [Emericellopsis cladophorae]|uniref:Respiratory supercomplex factor 2 -like protein n=1 Tax=Emericellopsis cladophorae TaxID=2686198 RepID=A0A9P9XUW0_9HYPO|nr:Respiratory supercomplex factor 2 -like protein [Emericellopsis cladophorae]KAI6778058.1 Respiratory supercomplex factor 2 -like protein [Emericellopsis cladophorae]
MKIIESGEEKQYYDAIVSSGAKAGLCGLALGVAAMAGLHSWYPPFRQLPLYIKSTSAIYPGILATSIGATHASHSFQSRLHPEAQEYMRQVKRQAKEAHRREPRSQREREWLHKNQYYILGGIWASTMASSLAQMRHDHFTSGARKLVQARVTAQASTLAVLLVTAAIEYKDRRKRMGKFQPVVLVHSEASRAGPPQEKRVP